MWSDNKCQLEGDLLPIENVFKSFNEFDSGKLLMTNNSQSQKQTIFKSEFDIFNESEYVSMEHSNFFKGFQELYYKDFTVSESTLLYIGNNFIFHKFYYRNYFRICS